MKALRAIIADDEELARGILREYIERPENETGIEIVAECANGFEAVKSCGELKPDVLFLDIQMPKLDGFEVLELVDRGIAVVFVTAFDQYAMKAFDAAAVDYLLKPFGVERFRAALGKVRRRVGEVRPASLSETLQNAARPPGAHLERIVVKDGARVHVIPAGKLDYAEAQDDYVALRSDGKSWLKQQTIASLEAALDPKRFVRLHRSYLVNLERITRIDPNTKDTWLAVLSDGTKIPVSRGGYAKFNALIGA
ncbi:MAG TPA: LytTR family DNA-binding domain-containing protein [Bryobacteraceae bacterium]|nr:LytTR family DNA-binding domain-containing protein [Bryobacteraceae bacterium]